VTGPAEKAKSETPKPAEFTEADLKKLLVGKDLYLRGGYLDNTLSFNEHGALIGRSPRGSYTLCAVKINKVRLTKHKVELEGERYGLHFLGALASEDPSKAVDRVNITPKKKVLRITIDRELVVAPKKEGGKRPFGKTAKPAAAAPPPAAAAKPAATPAQPAAAATHVPPGASAVPAATSAPPAAEPNEPSEAEQIKAEIAAAPAAERPAEPGSVTRTISPEHATKVLKDALDHIFAQGIDAQLLASMPPFWRLYYQAVADKSDYRPTDAAVQRQNMVDQKARLLSFSEPASNEYAQANGVAGMALYHTVVGANGKAGEIAVGRPIGFGLDENAVEAIRKATFEPAIKDGKPVPVLLNLVVQFRIYSKRTAEAAKPGQAGQPAQPSLPGPYSRQEQP
jgi:TonB family protein